MNFVENIFCPLRDFVQDVSAGMLRLPQKTRSYLFAKVKEFAYTFFTTQKYALLKSSWSFSLLTIVKFSVIEIEGPISILLDLSFAASGVWTLFHTGQTLRCLYGKIRKGSLDKYFNKNLISHSRHGFSCNRAILSVLAFGVHAVTIPALALQTQILRENPFAHSLLCLSRFAGLVCLGGLLVIKLEDLGQTFKQNQMIKSSALKDRKILIVEAEEDHNNGLFPYTRFLKMLKPLVNGCYVKRIVVESKSELEQSIQKFSDKFSIIWLRTHSWGVGEDFAEGPFFSPNFMVEQGDELFCLKQIMEEETKIILEGCSLAQKKDKTQSFAEDLSETLSADIYSSKKPVTHVNISWNEEDFVVQLLDSSDNDITSFISNKKQK